MDELNLDQLKLADIPGLSKEMAALQLQASIVCLDRNGHSPGSFLENNFEDRDTIQSELFWSDATNDQVKRTWADLIEATEFGASGIACLLIVKMTKYTILEQSIKDTGFDYWLCTKEDFFSEDYQVFPRRARMEVSGIFRERKGNTVASRIKIKDRQIRRSDSTALPAYVAVVEFGKPQTALVRHE